MNRSIVPAVCASWIFAASIAMGANEAPPWGEQLVLPRASDVRLSGEVGQALDRGLARLAQEPYTTRWLLADVSFEMERIFTNYSGDASGRYLELATLTREARGANPVTLAEVMRGMAQHQKPDGHFGVALDLRKPMKRGDAPIPMLWGNARLLVGLIAAAEAFNHEPLRQAAKRLGDFYVNTGDVLCDPKREAELRATGTYGDGFACCYFPAIEPLVLLYQSTRDERYLAQARRMAEFFLKFDALPTDHSHGNLCAYRGILMLYEATKQRTYLDRAVAKWEAAVNGGYVWPGGGIGEHWAIFHPGDEGCSESDWLRFNLELWRWTGQPRYLDMAERLLHNQYLENQCPNGGFGWRNFDGDSAGPIGTRGAIDEWPFCCSFHGPLGLHFLKQYLAVGSAQGVMVNLPLDFASTLDVDHRPWQLDVRSAIDSPRGSSQIEIDLAPGGSPARTQRMALWVRVPWWAGAVKSVTMNGRPIEYRIDGGYVRVEAEFGAGRRLSVAMETPLRLEGRRFAAAKPQPGDGWVRDAALFAGPRLLRAAPVPGAGRPALLAYLDSSGALRLPYQETNAIGTIRLPAGTTDRPALAGNAIAQQPAARLLAGAAETRRRSALMADWMIIPAPADGTSANPAFAQRLKEAEQALAGPFFGDRLEQNPELWIASSWQFSPQGLTVTGGDIGLLDGEGYADYRFEFELTLPNEGQGIAGWVVRAADTSNCLMFQIQSADSPYVAPEFKTKPNTLRPHLRKNGQWTIADPVPLPIQLRRNEPHRIAVECRGSKVEVFLDGQKIHSQADEGRRSGTVGFRASGAPEQGRFKNVALRKL